VPAIAAQYAQRPLDALNFFLADVRDGLGPYLAIYLLTEQKWNEASKADGKRPPTEAALLLLGWFWWLKPRRGKPFAHMSGGIKLPDLSKQRVLLSDGIDAGVRTPPIG
jgi:hypothetical protein